MAKWEALEKQRRVEEIKPLKHTLRMELLKKLSEDAAKPQDEEEEKR